MDRFISHLGKVRNTVASNLLSRLSSYIQLSTATADLDTKTRDRREAEAYYHNTSSVDDEGGYNSPLTHPIPVNGANLSSGSIPCYDLTERVDRLTCMFFIFPACQN